MVMMMVVLVMMTVGMTFEMLVLVLQLLLLMVIMGDRALQVPGTALSTCHICTYFVSSCGRHERFF